MFVTIVDADDLDLFIHRLDHRGTDGAVNTWGRSTSYQDAKTLARCLHSVHLSFSTCRPSIGFFYDNAPLQYTDITGRLNLPSSAGDLADTSAWAVLSARLSEFTPGPSLPQARDIVLLSVNLSPLIRVEKQRSVV